MDTIKEMQETDYDLSLIKQGHVIAAIKELATSKKQACFFK